MRTCSTCRYWWRSPNGNRSPGNGECRHDTPVADMETAVAFWPLTDGKSWCGQHEPSDPLGFPTPNLREVKS